jgi:hypothetical protein
VRSIETARGDFGGAIGDDVAIIIIIIFVVINVVCALTYFWCRRSSSFECCGQRNGAERAPPCGAFWCELPAWKSSCLQCELTWWQPSRFECKHAEWQQQRVERVDADAHSKGIFGKDTSPHRLF